MHVGFCVNINFSCLLGKYIGVGMLDLVNICLLFKESAQLFSKVPVPFCIYTSSVLEFQLFCILASTCIAINFPLRTAFAASHRFWIVMFSLSYVSRYFFISSLISSMISWLLCSVLFSLHGFVFLTDFFL